MARQKLKNAGDAAWRTQWPRTADLKTWFRAMLQKCDAIEDDERAADKAILPIQSLAEEGAVDEALKWVNRFLRRLPREKVLPTVQIAELGAKICLKVGDFAGMEKYLAIAAATEPFNKRKCDKGFSLDSVRKFRAENGLLNPADARNEEERFTAQFEGAARRCDQAIAARDFASAKAAAAEMETVALGAKEKWKRRLAVQQVTRYHAKLKDAAAVKRAARELDEEDRRQVVNSELLLEMGLKEEALALAEKEIARELDELRETMDPDIHFAVDAIGYSLDLLVEQGAKDKAKRALQRTLKEMQHWPVIENGWVPSAVYTTLAKAVAKVEGPAAADTFLKQAINEAKSEKRTGWRKGAMGAALDVKAEIGQLDEAIEQARKLRSPTQRRMELGKLLAKAGRWTELREVLSQVASPEEAAEVAWWIKFELPGGEAK